MNNLTAYMMAIITIYAAAHLAEDVLNSLFEWIEHWHKSQNRIKNKQLQQKEVLNFYWSLLRRELYLLGYKEPTFSRKYDSMTFIGSDHSIGIGTNGTVYGCSGNEFKEITAIVRTVKEITELWDKSIPALDESIYGYRVLAQLGNTLFVAKDYSCGVDYALWQKDSYGHVEKKKLGEDYTKAKEAFSLTLLLDAISQMPEDAEAKEKKDILRNFLHECN